MSLSVVTVTYNSAQCIGECLTSLSRLLAEAEIVVVDNGSRDGTRDVVAAVAPHARVVATGANVGFGRACNAGAEAATGTHVLFLNPDVRVTAVDRPELERLLGSRPFGLAAPLLLVQGGGSRRHTVQDYPEPHWLSDYFQVTLHLLRPRELAAPRRRAGARRSSAWVSGAMFLVDRAEFLGLGGFDPRFFLYYEDRDLSARYRSAGLPIRRTRALVGEHVLGRSSDSDSLGAERMAWTLLGWVQYLHIWRGADVARRSSRLALSTLRGMRYGLDAARRTTRDGGRVARKARQVDELLSILDMQARADANGGGFCPDARELVRGHLVRGAAR